jgi:hypothetical protein
MRPALKFLLLCVALPANLLGDVCFALAMFASHLWTAALGYIEGGWMGAAVSFCTPVLAEMRFLWVQHRSPGGIDPLYLAVIAAMPAGWAVGTFGAFLRTIAESKLSSAPRAPAGRAVHPS